MKLKIWKYVYLSSTIRRHLERSLQSRKFLVLLILYVYILKMAKNSSTCVVRVPSR